MFDDEEPDCPCDAPVPGWITPLIAIVIVSLLVWGSCG